MRPPDDMEGRIVFPSTPRQEYDVARRTAHIQSFDHLRNLAAILVAISHIALLTATGPSASGRVKLVMALGGPAVDLFMVLSGYVVTLSWLRQQKRGGEAWAFYIGRLMRLMPVYILSLGISLLAWAAIQQIGVPPVPGFVAYEHLLTSSDVIANIVPIWLNSGTLALNPPWWTLQVELFAMLLTPVIVGAASRGGHEVVLGWAITLGLLAVGGSRYGIAGAGQMFMLTTICLGVWLALNDADDRRIALDEAPTPAIIIIGLIILSGLLVLRAASYDPFLLRACGAVGAICIIMGLRRSARSARGRTVLLPYVRLFSYPYYVIHYPITAVMVAVGYAAGLSLVLCAIIGALLAIPIACLAAWVIEKSAIKRASAFVSKHIEPNRL